MSAAVENTTVNRSVFDGNGSPAVKPKILIWRHPLNPGTFVVNCDASYRASSGTIGYGFIIRDYVGRIVLARAVHFRKNVYVKEEVDYGTVVVLAEMLAIQDGLQHARKLGLMNVEIQSDSKIAISIINGSAECPFDLFRACCGIKFEASFFRGVEFNFIYRECNRPADFLSKFLKVEGRVYFNFSGLPDKLEKLIYEDAMGFIQTRF